MKKFIFIIFSTFLLSSCTHERVVIEPQTKIQIERPDDRDMETPQQPKELSPNSSNGENLRIIVENNQLAERTRQSLINLQSYINIILKDTGNSKKQQ